MIGKCWEMPMKLRLQVTRNVWSFSTETDIFWPSPYVSTKGQLWILFKQNLGLWGYGRMGELCFISFSLVDHALIRAHLPPIKPILKSVMQFMPNLSFNSHIYYIHTQRDTNTGETGNWLKKNVKRLSILYLQCSINDSF